MLGVTTASRSASVERTVMLTDAVVAIAMTLLVLPLVEAVPEVDLGDVWAFVDDHLSLFVSFVVSFLVILLFWAAHQRLFELVADMTTGLRLLTSLWLMLVAFLPFPTALIGRGPTTSTVPIYIGTVLTLSVVSASMTEMTRRLVADEGAARYLRVRAITAWVSVGVLAVCAVVSAFAADLGLLGLLLIVPVRLVGGRWSRESQSEGLAKQAAQ